MGLVHCVAVLKKNGSQLAAPRDAFWVLLCYMTFNGTSLRKPIGQWELSFGQLKSIVLLNSVCGSFVKTSVHAFGNS